MVGGQRRYVGAGSFMIPVEGRPVGVTMLLSSFGLLFFFFCLADLVCVLPLEVAVLHDTPYNNQISMYR